MSEIRESFQAGVDHHRAGRFLEAEKLYRRVLELYPRHSGAMHLLGLIAFQVGKTELAAEYVEQAIKLDAFRAPYPADLGEIYRALGRIPEAIASYRKALQLNPKMASAHALLGSLLESEGKREEALECYHKALSIDPACVEANVALGAAMLSQRKIPEAQVFLEKAAQRAPDNPQVYLNLGACLLAQDKLLDAIACFQNVARLQPDSSAAHCQLGWAYQQHGQLTRAVRHYRKTIELAPQLAEVHHQLGVVRRRLGRLRKAVESFEDAARLRPDDFAAHLNLASLRVALVQPDKAVAAARRACQLRPDSAAAAVQLARGLQIQGDTPAAIAAFRRAVELDPGDAQVHSDLVGALNADPHVDAAMRLAEHRAWARRHAEPQTASARPHRPDRAPDRRLRIGYVSPHFRQHALNAFSRPLLAAHDRERFEIFCYADSETADDVTAQFEQLADGWRPIAELSEADAARLVRSDNIDILVDLAGHLGNRLGIFAAKPAPIQVAYLGYPSTTGMSAMDYRLTDAHADPPGQTDPCFTEKLVRLPRSFFCYAPPEDSPEVNRLPALEAGRVTLGWLGGTMRTTHQAVELWARLLAAIPDARLRVVAYRPGIFEQRVQEAMTRGGVDPARVEILQQIAPDERLRLHHEIDLALDSFPLGGHAAVCDALWMGVPAVVHEPATSACRFGASALAALELSECIAGSVDDYQRIVVALAGDLPRLSEMRNRLRKQMSASPLVDAAGLARDVEEAYRQMWRAWCQRA
jgi:predicted O-linked N-acetylglucosamine transferase (SPINDLY family)